MPATRPGERNLARPDVIVPRPDPQSSKSMPGLRYGPRNPACDSAVRPAPLPEDEGAAYRRFQGAAVSRLWSSSKS